MTIDRLSMMVWLIPSRWRGAPAQFDLAQRLHAGRPERGGRLDRVVGHAADPEGDDPDRRRQRVDQRRDGRGRRADQEQQRQRREVRERRHDLHHVEDRRGIALNRLLRPAAMPSGRPMMRAMTTAASRTRERGHAASQRPRTPMGREAEAGQQREPDATEERPSARRPGDDAGPAERREDLVEQVDERGHADPDRVEDHWTGCPGDDPVLDARSAARKMSASSSWGTSTGR